MTSKSKSQGQFKVQLLKVVFNRSHTLLTVRGHRVLLQQWDFKLSIETFVDTHQLADGVAGATVQSIHTQAAPWLWNRLKSSS